MSITLPCDVLPTSPPALGDELSQPTAEILLPQVLACAPRGPAWGTDEAGDGKGASPEQLKVWRGISAGFAGLYGWAWEVALQAFPTSVSIAIDDWERELALPDPCGNPPDGIDARRFAVRARLTAVGGASPGYFICLARAAGYEISIAEPTAFECSFSECNSAEETTSIDPETIWIVQPESYRQFEFEAGAGGGELGDGGSRLVAYTDITGLECLLRRAQPVHTTLVFIAANEFSLDFSKQANSQFLLIL